MAKLKILISGAGIAGLTLAWWLRKYGYRPVVIEKAPALRTGGYMVDFWGLGFDTAEKMGILDILRKEHVSLKEIKIVNKKNKRRTAINYVKLSKLLNSRLLSLLRSDIARVLYDQIKDDVEFRFGLTVKDLKQSKDSVKVEFSDGTSESFEYVFGADGQHSKIRALLFGKEENYERYLGYYTVSYTMKNFMGKNSYYIYGVPNKQVIAYQVHDDDLAVLFNWKSDKLNVPYDDLEGKRSILKEVYGDLEWRVPELLDRMDSAPDFYWDSVSQIKVQPWYKGRVALVGDASHCVSLIAGEGCSFGMAGPYILAGELKKANGNHEEAFSRYQEILRPEVERKQDMAYKFAKTFIPYSRFSIFKRNLMTKLMYVLLFPKLIIKKMLSNDLELPEYGGK